MAPDHTAVPSDLISCDDRQRGATAVEYGLLVALIAGVCIATVGLLGDVLPDLYDSVQWW